jgi:hypothetical protein
MRFYQDEGRRIAIMVMVMVMVSRANLRPTVLWQVPFTAFVIYVHLAVA